MLPENRVLIVARRLRVRLFWAEKWYDRGGRKYSSNTNLHKTFLNVSQC
jgi:hypothetical protein